MNSLLGAVQPAKGGLPMVRAGRCAYDRTSVPHGLSGKGSIMRMIAMSVALSLYAATALAAGASCKDTAAEKKLAGAALTSFMTKCQKDAQASCDTAAQEKKLNGAAKTSFTKKCVKDATGA